MVFKSAVTVVVGFAIGFVALIVGGVNLIGPYVFDLRLYLLTVSVWDVLSALAPLLAPLVSIALLGLGHLCYKLYRRDEQLHDRIDDLEDDVDERLATVSERQTQLHRSMYGDADNPVDRGVTYQLDELQDRLDQLHSSVTELKDSLDVQDSYDQ